MREKIIAEARSWIGTPYHNCADIKGVGVDCGMLLVRVFVDLKLCPPFDPRPYSPDWHLHQEEERYLAFVGDRGAKITGDLAQPGDVMVFRYGRCYSHGAIITAVKPLTIVHASADWGCVAEEEVARNSILTERDRRPIYFSPWGKRS